MSLRKIAWIIGSVFLGIIVIFSAANAVSSPSESPTLNAESPSDTISEAQIRVYGNKVIIEITNAQWSSYTKTKSMSPVLDYGANGIEIIPKSRDELHIGDIVAYETIWNNIPVIHRIIDIKQDGLGTYYVMKGDNNAAADSIKVRFDQMRYKLVAIIY